jgi:hypothetical protein
LKSPEPGWDLRKPSAVIVNQKKARSNFDPGLRTISAGYNSLEICTSSFRCIIDTWLRQAMGIQINIYRATDVQAIGSDILFVMLGLPTASTRR